MLLYAFFGVISLHLPANEDATECSETSAYKIQKPGSYPEESIQRLEKGESLKSRILCCYLRTYRHFVPETRPSVRTANWNFQDYHKCCVRGYAERSGQ